jgi:hypothetical protein
MGIEGVSAVATFEQGVEGRWGVKRDRVVHDEQAAFVVREFEPWSPARQRELDALILIGRWHAGSVLRSDEVAALRGTPHLVGVEWQALRWEAVPREPGRQYNPAP